MAIPLAEMTIISSFEASIVVDVRERCRGFHDRIDRAPRIAGEGEASFVDVQGDACGANDVAGPREICSHSVAYRERLIERHFALGRRSLSLVVASSRRARAARWIGDTMSTGANTPAAYE